MSLLESFARSCNLLHEPIKMDIGVLSNGYGYTTPMVLEKLNKNSKANSISYEPPENDKDITKEVNFFLNYIKENNLEVNYGSRAQAYLELVKSKKIDAPQSLKIIEKIQEQAKKLDSIFLPGGADIPSIWYEDDIDETHETQYRTLIELTLISEARKRGIPLMGVCRGFQILNVFHGEKLKDNLDQSTVKVFELIDDEKKGLLADLFRQNVHGKVMHVQGVDIVDFKGEGDLEALAQMDGILVCVESKYPIAAPIIATQFHPECYGEKDFADDNLSPNNEQFFTIFYESTATYRNKKQITPDKLIEARQQLQDITLVNQKPKQASLTSYFWNLLSFVANRSE